MVFFPFWVPEGLGGALLFLPPFKSNSRADPPYKSNSRADPSESHSESDLPFWPSACQSVRPSVCPSLRQSVRLPVGLSVRPSVGLSASLSVCLPASPSVCLSVRYFCVPGGNAREKHSENAGF